VPVEAKAKDDIAALREGCPSHDLPLISLLFLGAVADTLAFDCNSLPSSSGSIVPLAMAMTGMPPTPRFAQVLGGFS